MGKDENNCVEKVLAAFPNAVILEKGEHYAAFSGGQSVARGSHWYVKFTFPKIL